jgi:hypothetical protein
MGVLQICTRGSSQPRWCVGACLLARFVGVQICQETRQLERAVKLELWLMFVLECRAPSKIKLCGLYPKDKQPYRIAGLKSFGFLVAELLEHVVHHLFGISRFIVADKIPKYSPYPNRFPLARRWLSTRVLLRVHWWMIYNYWG